jgi:uncharacterized repeat protein (TIGR02543 family)
MVGIIASCSNPLEDALDTFKVAYDGNESTSGLVPIDNNAYEEGAIVTVMGNTGNLARPGYTFDGWNTAADGGGTSYAPAETFTMGTIDVTLYAQWVQEANYVTTLAGTAGTSGSADGVGLSASFSSPAFLDTDGTRLFVADLANHTVRQIEISTGAVTTLAGTAGTPGSADGIGASALFDMPMGIATDGTYVYVVDSSQCTIRRITIATGAVTTIAGSAGTAGSDDGVGSAARFSDPYDITTDGANLYVTDFGNSTIRQIEIASGVVTTLAGTAGSIGSDDGIGAAASFNSPAGLTTDGTNLYVADTSNYTIRQVVIATGAVTTLAGTAGSLGSDDGIGGAASFNMPVGITSDGGNLYVTDMDNHTIRQIVIAAGAVTTLAGTAGSPGSDDGSGAGASFNTPVGIATDGTDLYVGDYGNHTIRRISR